MASMFKKPKRNFRKKLESDNSDNENNDDAAPKEKESGRNSNVMTVADLKKSREKKKNDKSDNAMSEKILLSFEDADDHEEDTEMFCVKKSSHSKKVVKELKKKALQEREETHQKITNTQQSSPGEYSKERLKELESKQKVIIGSDRTPSPFRDEEESPVMSATVKRHDQFSSVLQTGLIPDANTIHAIRKKRQLAREKGGYISLDDTVTTEKSKSRLIREDENDLSDDDCRIDFSINSKSSDRQKIRDSFLAAEQGSDEEDGDRDNKWEEQQIRKGVTGQQVTAMVDILKDQHIHSNSPTPGYSSPHVRGAYPAPADFSHLTIDAIKANLQERLAAMETVHRSHLTERDQLDVDTATTESEVTTGQGSTKSLEERYKFFQEMRGYVRDVIACLNEKVVRINKLEARYNFMQKTRAAKLISRRQQDVTDQCQDYTSTGRPVPDTPDPTRQQRTADREARRARRRRIREKRSIVGHHDGLSSDDEENPSEISKYRSDLDLIKAEIGGVFDDAVEDYFQITEIRARFEEWKFAHNASYAEAYIGLCLPKLVTPIVRLQLILWNPLEEGQVDMEDQSWYRDLVLIGHQAGVEVEPGDDDVRVIPAIVEKVIIPKITDIVSLTWDPMSTTHTCRLVNLTRKLIADYPPINKNSKHLQAFLKAVVTRIRKTLDEDVFMPLYPKSVIENKNDEASVFFHRQFWTCVKLLGNVLSWSGILEDSILQQLSLDSLLNRYIVLGLQVSGVNDDVLNRCQTIVSTFPKPWFDQLDSVKTMPQLENLCRYLIYAAGIVGNAPHDATDAQRKLSRERVKRIIKLLMNMSAMDHATDLRDRFAIKI